MILTDKETGREYKVVAALQNGTFSVLPIPRHMDWSKVCNGTLVRYTCDKPGVLYEFDREMNNQSSLRFAHATNVWTGGSQPVPDYVRVNGVYRNGDSFTSAAKDLDWGHLPTELRKGKDIIYWRFAGFIDGYEYE